nr:hypothetical protein A8713_031935 [Streptomyces sp. SAT1]
MPGARSGDVIAEFAVFGSGDTLGGIALPAEYIGDYVLYVPALVLGAGFQFVTIAPLRGRGLRNDRRILHRLARRHLAGPLRDQRSHARSAPLPPPSPTPPAVRPS